MVVQIIAALAVKFSIVGWDQERLLRPFEFTAMYNASVVVG
jgi:hypothetical protein